MNSDFEVRRTLWNTCRAHTVVPGVPRLALASPIGIVTPSWTVLKQLPPSHFDLDLDRISSTPTQAILANASPLNPNVFTLPIPSSDNFEVQYLSSPIFSNSAWLRPTPSSSHFMFQRSRSTETTIEVD